MWTRFFDTAFEDGHWHLQLQISPHLPLTTILGREVTFGGFILIIIAPPYGSDIDDRHALRRKPTRNE